MKGKKYCSKADRIQENILLPFSDYEKYLFNYSDTVEYALTAAETQKNKQELLYKMRKALLSLPDNEFRIIKECYFYSGKKAAYSELAQSHGISRQAYCKRLKKILLKLRKQILKDTSEQQ